MLAIQIDELSKMYRLGSVGTGTLAHDLNRWWHRVRGRSDPYAKIAQVNDRAQALPQDGLTTRRNEYVWALRNLNLRVPQGEILGIIGRNGAGKSTLLKLLSRVTAPSEGTIRTLGRIASLLEVGTGFHPEMTGRENIYLNGGILGMRRHEISERFDEIVEFSGCGKYIDTPVKRFSSGMLVRLGFAVAAHLNCDIMIIDEVLAVGDADFQRKCISKMKHLNQQGRTVLVVSHQLNMITAICDRAIVLNQGQIEFDGAPAEAVLHYQPTGGTASELVFDASRSRDTLGDHRAKLCRAWLEDAKQNVRRTFDWQESFWVKMEFEYLDSEVPLPFPNFHFFDQRGEYLFVVADHEVMQTSDARQVGRYLASCQIPACFLNTGTFTVGVAATCTDHGTQVCFFARDALTFQITEQLDETLDTSRGGYAGAVPGPMRPRLTWQTQRVGSPQGQTK